MIIEKFQEFTVRNRGCVMMKLDIPDWNEVCSFIKKEDVYEQEDKGIVDDPHVTVLYGYYSFVSPNDVVKVLRTLKQPTVEFGDIGVFENNPEFDVVMIKVKSDNLAEMNLSLSALPHETTYSDYKPHVTIAYVKKGTGKKYEGLTVNFPSELVLTDAVYSMPDGQKISIELNER